MSGEFGYYDQPAVSHPMFSIFFFFLFFSKNNNNGGILDIFFTFQLVFN